MMMIMNGRDVYNTIYNHENDDVSDNDTAGDTANASSVQELEALLPVSTRTPQSQSSKDKTSVIRLSVADLRCRDVISRGKRSFLATENKYFERGVCYFDNVN